MNVMGADSLFPDSRHGAFARPGRKSIASSAAPARRSCCCTAIRRRTRCGTGSRRRWRANTRSCVADLRGYGDSGKPASDATHAAYSKRAMAQDMVEVMRELGFPRFRLAGHDRGGRVAHRLCVDHPDAVERVAVLDISPTRTMFRGTNQAFATAYYHWFFLIQPFDLPERMIGADPTLLPAPEARRLGTGLEHFDPRALAEYERCFADPATIHATCEDYRAAASIDLEHDDADVAAGRKVALPAARAVGRQGRGQPDVRSAARLGRGRRRRQRQGAAVGTLPARRKCRTRRCASCGRSSRPSPTVWPAVNLRRRGTLRGTSCAVTRVATVETSARADAPGDAVATRGTDAPASNSCGRNPRAHYDIGILFM